MRVLVTRSKIMSITVDYFFNHNESLQELANSINACLGSQLAPYENDAEDFFCRFCSTEMSLGEHSLENDRDCDFENYRYQLGFRTSASNAILRPIQVSVMSCVIYALYVRRNITGLLVYNIQRTLARYIEREDSISKEVGLFDEFSQRFIEFPAHINELEARIDDMVNVLKYV